MKSRDDESNWEQLGWDLFPNSNALQIIISVEVVAPPPLFCLLQRELINEQINQLRCKMFASSSTLGLPACASPERDTIEEVKVMWVRNSNFWSPNVSINQEAFRVILSLLITMCLVKQYTTYFTEIEIFSSPSLENVQHILEILNLKLWVLLD